MQLAIITDEGDVELVLDDDDEIEGYDLHKPLAAACVIGQIMRTLDHIKERDNGQSLDTPQTSTPAVQVRPRSP